MAPRTLYEKIWDSHVVEDRGGGFATLYVDGHLVDEVHSPQAFDGLRAAGLTVRRPSATLAVADHNVPTTDRRGGIAEPQSRQQVDTLVRNVGEFGIPYLPVGDPRQGIVHVIGPEQGFTRPGMTVMSGDSHASTHGAFGTIAFGIGASQVELVLATQTILAQRSKTMRITLEGTLPTGVTAKDLIMFVIGRIGTAGANGHVIEYAGPAIRALSMEGRMTVANMSIEAGAIAGLIAPDDTTFAYLKGRPYVPTEAAWDQAVAHWRGLATDEGARYDREVSFDVSGMAPQVTWGTSPQDVLPVTGRVPDPADEPDPDRRRAAERSLAYMDLAPGMPLAGVKIDTVFIGSCTNGRIEDLRAAAAVAEGRKVASHVRALVVPGSGLVKAEAEREGLDRILLRAGFEWREPGCSMCLAMNADRLAPGERCVSSSNRNFEGRQGAGGRTHLASPAMAAAAAVSGCIADVRALSS